MNKIWEKRREKRARIIMVVAGGLGILAIIILMMAGIRSIESRAAPATATSPPQASCTPPPAFFVMEIGHEYVVEDIGRVQLRVFTTGQTAILVVDHGGQTRKMEQTPMMVADNSLVPITYNNETQGGMYRCGDEWFLADEPLE